MEGTARRHVESVWRDKTNVVQQMDIARKVALLDGRITCVQQVCHNK